MQLVRNIYPAVGDSKTFERKIKEAIVAVPLRAPALEAVDPHRLPQHRPLRHGRRADRRGRPDGLVGLLRPSRLATTRSRSRRCSRGFRRRRPPTTRSCTRRPRWRAATRSSRRWRTTTTSRRPRPRAAEAAPLERRPQQLLQGLPRELLPGLRAPGARLEVRPEACSPRATSRSTPRSTPTSARSRPRRSTACSTCRATPRRRSSPRTRRTATSTRWRSPGATRTYKFNLATQAQRQPGSTFKAIVLADALSRGIDPFTTTYFSHTLPAGWLPGYPTYTVTIDGGGQPQRAAQPQQRAGRVGQHRLRAAGGRPRRGRASPQMAHALGVTSHLDSYPAEALGGLHARRHAARDGERLRDDRRRRLAQQADHDHARSSSPTATSTAAGASRTASRCSRPPPRPSRRRSSTTTSWAAPRRGSAIGCPSAAKTGTTSGLVDAWLDGFTPTRTTVVWMGYPAANISMTDVHGQPQFGGAAAGPDLARLHGAGGHAAVRAAARPGRRPDDLRAVLGHLPAAGLRGRARRHRALRPERGERRDRGHRRRARPRTPGRGAPPPGAPTTTPATTTPATTTPATTTPATTTTAAPGGGGVAPIGGGATPTG